jgi:hypothetical protein
MSVIIEVYKNSRSEAMSLIVSKDGFCQFFSILSYPQVTQTCHDETPKSGGGFSFCDLYWGLIPSPEEGVEYDPEDTSPFPA